MKALLWMTNGEIWQTAGRTPEYYATGVRKTTQFIIRENESHQKIPSPSPPPPQCLAFEFLCSNLIRLNVEKRSYLVPIFRWSFIRLENGVEILWNWRLRTVHAQTKGGGRDYVIFLLKIILPCSKIKKFRLHILAFFFATTLSVGGLI